MNNKDYKNIPIPVKVAIMNFVAENNLTASLSNVESTIFSHECISASVILSRKLKSSQQEAQSLLKSLPSFPMFPSDSVGVVSTSSLQEQFIAFSLSKESLEFQSQAKILSNQLSYLLHDIHSSSLLTTLHTLNAKMYNDESCLVEISSYLNA